MSAGRAARQTCMEVERPGAPAHVRVLPDDVAGGLLRAEGLLRRGVDVDVRLEPGTPVDAALVGRLARLRLAARRSGAVLVLDAPDVALRHLAELFGLCEVLGVPATEA